MDEVQGRGPDEIAEPAATRVGAAEVTAQDADGELLGQFRGRVPVAEDPGDVAPHRTDVSEHQPDPGVVRLCLALVRPQDVGPQRLDLVERPILVRMIHAAGLR